jgi:CDP-diacylglycerol--glycerol-3-phosphate 3-phosphatidyltransferase
MGWANRITLSRAVLTLLLWALLTRASHAAEAWMWWVAFGLFVLAAASDALDGVLARRLQEVSTFGRIADPLVDKMLTIGTFVVLLGVPVLDRWLPAWAVALMLTREVLITTVRAAVEARGVNFQAIDWGKAKMVLQCLAVGGLLLCPLDVGIARDGIPALDWLPGGADTWNLTHVLVWLATLLTVFSGVVYVRRAMRVLGRGA